MCHNYKVVLVDVIGVNINKAAGRKRAAQSRDVLLAGRDETAEGQSYGTVK